MPRAGIAELLNLTRVLASGHLMQHAGDKRSFTSRFEAALAGKIGVKHALAVNSGTSGLITALTAAGIGPGDEVLIPAYTWVSTAIAPLAVGAVPILVDIDETLTIDAEDLERKISPYTRAIIPVHMVNHVCCMDKIMAVAERHELIVIEDACQAVGITYKGRRVGSIGDAGVFSFNHYKNMSSGEGGALLTNNSSLHHRAKVYHDVGSYFQEFRTNSFDFSGCNLRISELTGAVLHAQLRKLDGHLAHLKRARVKKLKAPNFSGVQLSPHHDIQDAVGLTFLFDSAGEAKRFAEKNRGVVVISDIKKYDYLSWLPVLQKCRNDPRKDPFLSAKRDITYSPDMCSKTLDILSRSCLVTAS